MRRYSFFYFLGQAFRGLWRNGVMTAASVFVLTSCLCVVGSFALLVFNINQNIDSLGELNQIRIFVDTELSSALPDSAVTAPPAVDAAPESDDASADSEPQDADGTQGELTPPVLSQDSITAKSEEELRALCTSLRERAATLSAFTDLPTGILESSQMKQELEELYAQIYYMEEGEVRTALLSSYTETEALCQGVISRIGALSELKAKVEGLGVRAELITKEKALQDQKAKYADYPELFANLSENPYPDAFQLTYDSLELADELEYSLNHLDGRIYRVEYSADVTENIESIRSVVVLVFTWFLIILFLVSFFVIINTVKLAVHARKEEIAVMYYVGATNFFITVPFVFEGAIIGLFSAVLAFFIQQGLYAYTVHMMSDFQMITVAPFGSVGVLVFLGFLAVGMLTGILGSSFSLRRYMKD